MLLFKIVVLQTIVFGLVLFFLKKILTGDTESAVNRLNNSYEDVKKKKEELTKMITQIETEYNQRKGEAEKIGSQLVDKAKEEGESKKADIVKTAKSEAEDIISKAMGTIDNVRADINRELFLKTVDICSELIKNILSQKAALQVHEIFVNEFLEELKGLDMSKIGSEVERIDIVTFKSLEEKEKGQIKEIAADKLKRQLDISESVDTKLLGGMVLKFGGLALDGTLAGKIRESALAQKKTVLG